MRNAFSLLALSATVAAQEPPVLINPAATTPNFNATMLGGGVTEVAQLTMIPILGSAPQKWYLTATVHGPRGASYDGYAGEVTSTGPGTYTVAALSADLSLVPAPTVDYFAFNASADLKVLVFDTGAATQPAVYVRTGGPGTAFQPFGSVPAPVPAGYRDSQMGNTITSWNGTTGVYEFVYIDGNDIKKVNMTLTAPSTVALGTPVTIATSATAKHSPSYLRQCTGLDVGEGRALICSHNISSADSWFRSSIDNVATHPTPLQLIFDDANWKANPGHIGGSTYWAYAIATYGNPMQEDILAMSSATVPAAGGAVTICAWAPPSAQPQLGFLMIGSPQIPGLDLSALGITGKLGLNPASLVFLFQAQFDPVCGEACFNFATGPLPRLSIPMQIGCINLATLRIFLGNTGDLLPQ